MSDSEAQASALKCKEEGNAAYKSRDFAGAIDKYKQAWELHKDITYLNNLAGAPMTRL
jgi:stress-induced-phosphoprotein 1